MASSYKKTSEVYKVSFINGKYEHELVDGTILRLTIIHERGKLLTYSVYP